MRRLRRLVAAPLLLCAGCVQTGNVGGWQPAAPALRSEAQFTLGRGKIRHVVVIVQENRTVDNLFNGFPGADTTKVGKNAQGQTVDLQPTPLTAPYDLSHRHEAWVKDYNHGAMNGFNTESENCHSRSHDCPPPSVASYGYVPRSEVEPYWEMARQYVFANRAFQSSEGPSFPAHQYIISGTSTIATGSSIRAAENAVNPHHKGRQGGCDSDRATVVATITTQGGPGEPVFPCFDRTSIMDSMNDASVSWRYYQERPGADSWNAVDAIRQIRYGSSYANVIWPSSRVLADINNDKLAQVTFITPSAKRSDHAGHTDGTGPDWVASIVNEIGKSKYWDSTAIFVVWDDWGGWYDHVKPVVYNSYELGFRVPLIAIGPYAKAKTISHKQHEFGSILKFVEEVFNLPSLGTTDARADDLSDCFDFSQRPRAFVPIRTQHGPAYFLQQPPSDEPADDDF